MIYQSITLVLYVPSANLGHFLQYLFFFLNALQHFFFFFEKSHGIQESLVQDLE